MTKAKLIATRFGALCLIWVSATVHAQDDRFSLRLFPRAEFVTAQGPFSQRASVRAQLRALTPAAAGVARLSLFADGFLERDWVDNDRSQIEARRSKETTSLDQAWAQWENQNLLLRVGRQALSWTDRVSPTPEYTLDWLSGRRWNRLFIDPPTETLSHPDAIRLTYQSDAQRPNWTADVVQVFQTAPQIFPSPFESVERREQSASLLRLARSGEQMNGSLLALKMGEITRFGGDLRLENPDFPCCRVWLEAGLRLDQENAVRNQFIGFGYSVSANDLTIAPAMTVARDPDGDVSSLKRTFQVNVHYQMDQWSLDTVLYYLSPSSDEHQSVTIHYESGEWYRYSLFWQRYRGKSGQLFGVYESQTQGQTVGVRAEINYELF